MTIEPKALADIAKVRKINRPHALLGATSTFNNIYMRPNIDNGGQVPAAGPYCQCPDIWPAGITPINNFETVLATQDSYNTQPPSAITLGMDNYIYVRGLNGSSTTNTVSVTLYYAPSAIIQFPSEWQNNVIQTDQPANAGAITNLASGAIGVVPNTFVWPRVPAPPNGSDHYCLLAQFNDANNSNPFPDITAQLDMANLITNNLMWGWHNVSLMASPANLVWSYETGLNIPSNLPAGYYSITVTPSGYVGWEVSFQCSAADSNGNPISLSKTPITQDNIGISVVNVYLEPGYNAMMTVYMYNPNNVTAGKDAKIPIAASYKTHSQQEFDFAVANGLVDWKLTRAVAEAFSGMPVDAYVGMGSVTGVLPS